MSLWNTRNEALTEFDGNLKDEVNVLQNAFDLLDECITRLETEHNSESYAEVCALTLTRAGNLLLASYNLSLDGLAQEAETLLLPFIEAFELIVYFNQDPSRIEEAINNRLPIPEEIAKRIQGQFKELRNYLNAHSSHFGLTQDSTKHLINWNTLKLKRTNLKSIFTLLIFLNAQAIECLFNLGDKSVEQIADRGEACKVKGFDVFCS